MGGNFVLRMATVADEYPIPGLRRILAISPAVDPGGATDRVDANPTIHLYFRRNWVRSLTTKQARFPELYDFRGALQIRSIRAMTEWLVRHYSSYVDADDYFAHYAVGTNMLANVQVPTTILSAWDDPIIEAAKIASLKTSRVVRVRLLRHGGHVGFVDLGPFRHCLPELVLAELARD
jgi:predicted alpha/beta-fold hydrolase